MGFGLVSFERAIVDSSIQVGVSGPTVWVKVEGKGSFLNSGNLKEFSREMLDRGYREFVVDLADCAMMDSTFMGTMASVALRLKELGHGHLHIVVTFELLQHVFAHGKAVVRHHRQRLRAGGCWGYCVFSFRR